MQRRSELQIRSGEYKGVAEERSTAAAAATDKECRMQKSGKGESHSSQQQRRLEDQACTAENILTGNATNVLYLPSVDKSGT